MQINDVEKLLGITVVGTPQEDVYVARLAAAIDYAVSYCREGIIADSIPAGAQMGIALLVKAMGENQNVASQSLGDMSKSFFEGATGKEAKRYLKPYVRLI